MSRRLRRRLRRVRPLLWVIFVGSGLLLVGGAVVGLQAWQAKHDLVEARSSIQAAHEAVKAGDEVGAKAHLDAARAQAHRAHGRVTGWVWSGYGHLPLAGPVVRETRGVIDVTDGVTRDVLGPLVAASPGSGAWSGQADLAALNKIAGPLALADSRLSRGRQVLAGLPRGRVRQVDLARDRLSGELSSLAVDLRDAAVAAKVLPSLLGASRPSRLLVVAQNLAEERATGGLIGSFALLSAQDGRITLERSGTDSELIDASSPVVGLGADFAARYGTAKAASTWRSANLTPDVPTAGAILAGLSAKQLHRPVDAVVFVDPVALAQVLRATGPVQVAGIGTLSADNAVPLLMKDVYARFDGPGQQPQRKEALRRSLDQVVRRLEQPVGGRLVAQVAHAAGTGHLRVYATGAPMEALLRRSRLAGALPDRGPYLSVVTQDVGGSKLDYYLHREVTYVSAPSPVAVDVGAGPETQEVGTVTVRLRSDAPAAGLPSYVTTRADARDGKPRPVGQLKSWVSVYLGPRSSYQRATVDGRSVTLSSAVEGGLTVLSTFVSIDPGSTVTLTLTIEQPAAPGSVLVWSQQPRIEPDSLTVRRSGSYATTYDLS